MARVLKKLTKTEIKRLDRIRKAAKWRGEKDLAIAKFATYLIANKLPSDLVARRVERETGISRATIFREFSKLRG